MHEMLKFNFRNIDHISNDELDHVQHYKIMINGGHLFIFMGKYFKNKSEIRCAL